MENTQKPSNNPKKIYLDLPKINTKTLSQRSSSKQNLHPIHINLQFNKKYNNLKKIYQIKQKQSNHKNNQKSPYLTTLTNKQKTKINHLNKTITNTKVYEISDQIEKQIKEKFCYHYEDTNNQHIMKEQNKKKIKIKLKYENKYHEFYVKAYKCQQLIKNITYQFAKIMYSLKNTYKRCQQIIGYQTITNNHQLNFILSKNQFIIPSLTNLKQLQIRAIFSPYILSTPQLTLYHFQFLKCLGSGGFSTVYLSRSLLDNKYYAIKLINKQFIIQSQRDGIIQNQRFILGQLKSSFITELEFAFETKNHFVFVIEYCPGGELFYQLKRVKRMKEEQAKFYFLEILIGLDYIHSKNIIYRDLKPQNLLIGIDGHIKIADFGLSKPIKSRKQQSYSFCGSPQYMAPEMLMKSGHNYLLDYYCLGALLYQLVIGVPPYYSLNQQQIYTSILQQQLSFPSHVSISQQLKSLLRSLLQKNHKIRLGCMFGVKQILLHPWIGKIKQKTIENKELIPPFIPNLEEFNFDLNDIKTDQQQIKQKIEDDKKCKNEFDTHFNKEFYYQSDRYKHKIQEIIRINRQCIINNQSKQSSKSRSYDNYNTQNKITQRKSLILKPAPSQSSLHNFSHRIKLNLKSKSSATQQQQFSQQQQFNYFNNSNNTKFILNNNKNNHNRSSNNLQQIYKIKNKNINRINSKQKQNKKAKIIKAKSPTNKQTYFRFKQIQHHKSNKVDIGKNINNDINNNYNLQNNLNNNNSTNLFKQTYNENQKLNIFNINDQKKKLKKVNLSQRFNQTVRK